MHTYSLAEKILFPSVSLDNKRLGEELRGKTVLITGASSGIGKQLAYMLASIDVHLVLVARREDRLLAMKKNIEMKSAKVSVCRADMRNQTELKTILAFLEQLPNGLDVVVSNAGKSINRPIRESLSRYHDFTRTMDINYGAPVQLLLSAIPALEKNKGQIINVSTINALLIPIPHWAAYQASKTAFDTWFRSAAPELNAIGIATTSIYLPLVKTPMIVPTIAYEHAPAMAVEHAARIICRSMYTKKKYCKPWWLFFLELASVCFRWLFELLVPIALREKGKSDENH
ncbi:SDR family NAD(P)-dependent oxidoreductase [Planococcus salinus]|uniref:SDR family NAD(P)-dependent oxidoreductase n=1 Tax=Planococcus salinus TaxID=1848460 RepID=A0A3M8PC17_9BACL|nr:SDR family NAD(P)-dependent oxidoreductase [Planococcus salinus]RNF41268.1 SDR family NAD(P)-dependent oxidoreductase [Planococcus salinus]